MHDIHTTASTRIRVKFCGITQLTDAIAAENLGVDALGFVFYEKSPRHISISAATEITKKLAPFTTKVALFANADTDLIKTVIDQVSIDLLQFHGDESAAFCQQFNRPYIKVIRVQTADQIISAGQDYIDASGFLLDTYHLEKPGGTGKTFDWNLIPSHLTKPIILAGGLNSENVKSAIERVKPYAVDVSSGIESSPGKKSFQRMQAFINEVNNVRKI